MKPKYQDIKRVFCSYPWSELATKNTGELVICREQLPDTAMGYLGSGDEYNIGRAADPQKVLNSDLHRDIRRTQMRGEWHSNCVHCVTMQQNPIKNIQRRLPEDREILGYIRNVDADGYLHDVKIRTLDLRFGNLCNHACLQCNPADSTMWYEDHAGFFGTEFNKGPGGEFSSKWNLSREGNGKLKSDVEPFIRSENFWRVLDNIAEDIIDIQVLGGEPFIMQDHDRVLDYFIDRGLAKNVVLQYNSNLSVINPKLLERWTHFKYITMGGSMDEIQDRFELIRYGGRWDRFTENVKLIQQVPNVNLWGLSVCYMIPNMFSIGKIDAWAADTGSPPISYRWIYGPAYMTLDSLPRAAKEELIEFNMAANTEKSQLMAKLMQSRLERTEDPTAIQTFVKLMDYLDRTRQQDWRATLPDVRAFLTKHCGTD
jgi:hypothetical protein